MARGHLFLIVVLLAGATVAGLLAVTRTAQSSPATSTTDPAISYRMKKLDRLEASLEKQLARHVEAVNSTAAPTVVYTRASSPVAGADHDDDDHEADDDHELSSDHEEDRDD